MIPVDGSFPNLLEWPSLLALEAGGEQAKGLLSVKGSVLWHTCWFLPPGPASAHEADTRSMLSV